ncbi:HNH endonuclease signature motif containing protein [Naasia aerilata]|uniref:DUF222 domain-containing protein n=1 Tax=Naasia aerilata TaxID=1162966 RepID=A0ABM8GEW1_9MICO|nr:HNH endonuclease signature motif containing protein [Naasia aerilata]BDZ46838.1 hypothetical protein GCM10025866_27470 [Naasia aerilata]
MNLPTDALLEQADRLARRVSGLPWGEAEDSLSRLLAGASGSTLLEIVETAGRNLRMAEATLMRAAGEIAKRSDRDAVEPLARQLGDRTAAALVARVADVPLGRAADWCRVGAELVDRESLTGEPLPSRWPALSSAVDGGEVAVHEARVILGALEAVVPHAEPERLAGLEEHLIAQARILSFADLSALCRAIPDVFDPEGAELREEELRAKSGFKIVHRRDGLLRWIIDAHPEAAGFLTAALDARTAPRRAVVFADEDDPEQDRALEDTRTLEQKRLDALQSICRDSLKADDGDVSGTPVTVVVHIPLEALESGIGAATIDGVDAPISAATARRLACDAKIIPVVLGGESEPLDLGRARRLFSQAQRLAMAVRDGGCVWWACLEPPSRCEAAHLTGWARGGRTDLAAGALLCPYHHRRFDNDGWELRVIHGARHLIPPPWVDATQRPRPVDRPRLP